MDKFVAASNYKVRNHIPDDLAFSILSKLPLKSLKRFGFVCKSWSLLFENPNFMNIYGINFLSNNHACYNDTSLLLHHKIDDSTYYDQKFALYSISGDRFETRVKLDWPNPFQEDDPFEVNYGIGFKILGMCSINGIICLHTIFQQHMILWNPATKEFKVIPHSPIQESNSGHYYFDNENSIFGYDRVRDDHKVIRHAISFQNPDGDLDNSWELYSLRSNSWKKLDDVMPKSVDYYEQVFMDGVGHWWGTKLETHNEASLVSFDFSNETFFTTPIPFDIIMGESSDFRLVWRHLLLLYGSIALIVNYTETTTFHISILGEVGVEDSWTKILVVGLLPCIEYPIGAWKNGNVFIRKKDGELAWYDLNTHMIEELGILLVRFNTKIVIYKESFLPIRGIND